MKPFEGLIWWSQCLAQRAEYEAHPALRIRGLRTLRERVEAAGFAVEDDTQLDGHERWYLRDPFGNRIELIEEVAS